MSTREPLPDFEDRAPRDRYCDLILTGGVTSAIAYPAAIFALATAYRLNSIGGSSSGGGAAALAAAAEYRRRHGSSDGFRILLERTAAVADEVNGKTRLAWLFQPARHSRRLFYALVPGIAKPRRKVGTLLLGLLRAYAIPGGFIGIAICLLTWRLAGLWAWSDLIFGAAVVTAFLIGAVLAALVLFLRDVARVVNDDYGLCSGIDSVEGVPPPLTQWLHDLIQEISGRQRGDPPLTFNDLASAPGSPKDTLGDLSPPGAVSINLQMYTANVTHGRPYVFPQQERAEDKDGDEEDEPQLYFRPSEMRRLFPPEVVEFMKFDPVTNESNRYKGPERPVELERPKNWFVRWLLSPPAAGSTSEPAGDEAKLEEEDALWSLPRKHLPILVASRMSVSFPVLFTAVPLWALDRRDEPGTQVFRRCLFSDGSLCSSFPIHLFDSLLPPWPTFGISLYELPARKSENSADQRRWFRAPKPAEGGTATLPEDHRKGSESRWKEFDYEPSTIGRLAGFANALLSTATDWNDAMLARLPGVRDRVAQVGLTSGTGGLNILMTSRQIESLAKLGGKAARLLVNRFARPSRLESGEMGNGWNEHRWVRFNVLRDSLANSLAGFTWSASQDRYARPIRELIQQAIDEAPLKGDERSRLLAADAAALDGVLTALIEAERALTGRAAAEQPYRPGPRPVMRVRPPL